MNYFDHYKFILAAIYFLEDLANLVEQTAAEVAPGVSTERHFLSPKHLKEHRTGWFNWVNED
jgi:hypothetical protein